MRSVRIALMLLLCCGIGFAALTMLPGVVPVVPVLRGELSLAPDSLVDFGRIAIGERGRSSIIATNTGTAPMSLKVVVASPGFSAGPESLDLAPGESRALAVDFRPEDPSDFYEGQLRVSSVDPLIGEHLIELRGAADGLAAIHVEPMNLSFGEVAMGDIGRASVRIENRGLDELLLTSISVAQPFAVEAPVNALAPGDGADFEVRFKPDELGRVEASLVVRSSDASKRSLMVNLRGGGVRDYPEPRIELETDVVEFGEVPVGASVTSWIEIKNAGVDPLNITRISVPKPFMGPDRGWRIEPNASYRLGFRFSPETVGAMSEPVTIYSNDPDLGVIELDLVGEGTSGREIAGTSGGSESGYRIGSEAGNETDSSLVVRDRAEGGTGSSGEGALETAAGPEAAFDPADPTSDDPTADEPSLVQAQPVIGEGSQIHIGTQSANVSNFHVDNISIDPGTRTLHLDNLMLPPVNFPMGDFVEFLPLSVSGAISDMGGFDQTVMLQLVDPVGNITNVPVKLSTGPAPVKTNTGDWFTPTGDALVGDTMTVVAAFQSPPGSSTHMLPVIMQLRLENIVVD